MSQFVQWWHENPDKAEQIREKRRKKLQDPEAAEAHRRRCRDYYARKKAERAQQPKTRGVNKPKLFWIDGAPTPYWGTGQVAAFLQISPATLIAWEERDVIPVEAKIQDNLRRRWWPQAFIETIGPLVTDYKDDRISGLTALRTRVHSVWNRSKSSERSGAEVLPDDDHRQPDDQEVQSGRSGR
jgi:hypothetical protein